MSAIILSKRLVNVRPQTATRGWLLNHGFVRVRFDDGKEKEFEVYKKELYDSLILGEQGLVTFKGYTILDFKHLS